MFANIHHLTSSAQFLQAVRERNFELARDITKKNPFAVRANESIGKHLTAGHIAVILKDFEMLEFFETLPHFDFDLVDEDGESPLFYAIIKRNFGMVKFFVEKGADLKRRSYAN